MTRAEFRACFLEGDCLPDARSASRRPDLDRWADFADELILAFSRLVMAAMTLMFWDEPAGLMTGLLLLASLAPALLSRPGGNQMRSTKEQGS